jgi:hydroxyacylglutathione hydrolase
MIQIHTIPAFENNYFWLIQPDAEKPSAFVVDPGAAEPVLEKLTSSGLHLTGILITHHHHDHIGGALSLSKIFDVAIYGPKSAKIPEITHFLRHGDVVQLEQMPLKVLELPGHTLDHIGYYFADPSAPLLFCGDTLFGGGCGRLFDGNAEQLFQSLQQISTLPDQTLIYCAHEYTLANLDFALHIEPNNAFLHARREETAKRREAHIPSIPTILAIEKQTNPFLRCHLSHIKERVEELSNQTISTDTATFNDTATFKQLRLLKDRF